MAEIGLSIATHDDAKESAALQQAVSLAPDSPVCDFYLGRYQYRHNDPRAKDSYARAKALGDGAVIAAVEREMKLIH